MTSILTGMWKFRAAAISAIAIIAAAPSIQAQSAAPRLITQSINPANLMTLAGNTRPEANAANDRGIVPDSFPLDHMLLQLQRSGEQEQAFNTLIDQLHDRSSPNFHKWLSIGEIGTLFGPSTADIRAVTAWLEHKGFAVNGVYSTGTAIDFSGTAGKVRAAFHTEIHRLSVNGADHIANMSDPQIPMALAPAVVGIVSLHDFRAQPQMTVMPPLTANTQYDVGPADLATIYNLNPVFTSGNYGQNQTIYLIETADVPVTSDWDTFRTEFSLPSYPTATLKTIHPPPHLNTPSNNCTDPKTVTEKDPVAPVEATLDTEYASAAAPGAAIVVVACANLTSTRGTSPTDGLLIAILNLIHGSYAPSVISMSYGESETLLGAAQNEAFRRAYQIAVSMGFSIFVSAGDAGAAESDRVVDGKAVTIATHGINVNGHASTWYNVAVGGTDFGDAKSISTYWLSMNLTGQLSALSYIPEIPWNDTCGSEPFAEYNGYTMANGGPIAFCNSTAGASYLTPKGGSGGASACATGNASKNTPGVVSGTCAGRSTPPWQTGVVGLPSNSTDYGYGVRVLPDVALFAANGPSAHAYVFCYSGPPLPQQKQKNCNGTPAGFSYGGGGTSFAAPIMAGIQALVNQQAGGPQGNPNYRYYQLAAQQYGATGSSACDSNKGNAVGASCIFYDITTGDNAVPCSYYPPSSPPNASSVLYNCYGPPLPPSGTNANGVFSISNSSYMPAFPATTGWDFTTGIGSVNVYNLVTNW
jgi:subtilase family serine protease